jgi:ABC-type multidrug transport system ATPase subunit
MKNAIVLKDISKKYKSTMAVKSLDMMVPQGVVYGLLGRNGAGKTTTIRIIMGLVKPDTGSVEVLGRDAVKERIYALRNIGAIIEYPGLYRNLTARQNLEITADLFYVDRKRIDEMLELVGLAETRKKKVRGFSTGMKQRLGIASALIHSPKILILDEPTNGLDPEGVNKLRSLIKNLSTQLEITVIMSSHILSEVQQLADYVGIIDEGVLVEQIAMDELNQMGQNHLLLEVDQPDETVLILQKMSVPYQVSGKEIKVFCKKIENEKINSLVSSKGIKISNMSSVKNSLEDRFMSAIGKHS